MGGSFYNQSRSFAAARGYQEKSREEIFSKNLHPSMDPKSIRLRESRDSENHPNSVPIIIGLDVTGSMGRIPENIIKEGLPKMISTIMELGISDPQILFLAIGDDRRDRAPLQVGQFESGDEEMNLWLSRVWLESGGGGNGGESYALAWYFAARHTVHDAFEKRNQKGFLFTIGDENVHEVMSANSVNSIMNLSYAESFHAQDLFKEASKTYNVFHINCRDGSYGSDPENQWRDIIGEGLLPVNSYRNITSLIAQTVVSMVPKNVVPTKTVEAYTPVNEPTNPQIVDDSNNKITL